MNKLISMVEFVNKKHKSTLTERHNLSFQETQIVINESYDMFVNYATFLSKKVKLSDFVPTDENGNVLEEPNCECLTEYDREGCCSTTTKCWHYKNALSKVIFDGCVATKKSNYYIVTFKDSNVLVSWNESKTIENLIPYNLTLKESVAKELGLI